MLAEHNGAERNILTSSLWIIFTLLSQRIVFPETVAVAREEEEKAKLNQHQMILMLEKHCQIFCSGQRALDSVRERKKVFSLKLR